MNRPDAPWLGRTDKVLAVLLLAGAAATLIACGSGPDREVTGVFASYPRSEAFDAIAQSHVDAANPEPNGERRLLMTTWFQDGDPRVARTSSVWMDGRASSFQQVREWGLQGFEKKQMTPQMMERLVSSLSEMPPSEQPSIENMLIVSFRDRGMWQTRLYDRTRRPPPVSTIFGVTGAPILP